IPTLPELYEMLAPDVVHCELTPPSCDHDVLQSPAMHSPPEALICPPWTSSLNAGAAVPTPTLPPEVIRIRSMPPSVLPVRNSILMGTIPVLTAPSTEKRTRLELTYDVPSNPELLRPPTQSSLSSAVGDASVPRLLTNVMREELDVSACRLTNIPR